MKTYKSKLQSIALDLIVKVSNFRLLSKERDVTGLSLDIEQNGLSEPIHVHLGEDKVYEIIRGHRRKNALLEFLSRDAAAFDKMFKAGIPCLVFSGLSRVEIENLKADSGNTVGLSDPFEAQMYLNTQFDNGVSMAQAATNAAGILDVVWPLKPEIVTELEGYRADEKRHRENGDETKALNAAKDYVKRYKTARHGKMQNSKTLYDGPFILMAAYYNHANRELPPSDSRYFVGKDAPMPKRWTLDRAAKLVAAHNQDKDAAKVTGIKVSKAEPGPIFQAAWNKWVEEEPKEAKKAPRSMSHKDIETAAEGFLSRIARKVADRCAGNGTPDKFAEDDRRAAIAELVAEAMPEKWAEIEAAFAEIKTAETAKAPEAVVVEAEVEAEA